MVQDGKRRQRRAAARGAPPPRSSGPNRARRAQPTPDDEAPRHEGPPIPADIEAKQLAPEIRGELTTLDRSTADTVARHLVAAGLLLDEDPEAALAHARAARARSGRIAAVREAVGIAAYHCGDWAQALAELRAARRMGSKSPLLPLIADCERGIGRPERAIELARSPEAAQLTGDDADELRIVVAGARSDLGQHEQALAMLSTPQLDPNANRPDGRAAVLRLRRNAAGTRAQSGGAAVVHQRRRRGCRGTDRRRRPDHGAGLT